MRVRYRWFGRFYGLLVILFLPVLGCSAENNETAVAWNTGGYNMTPKAGGGESGTSGTQFVKSDGGSTGYSGSGTTGSSGLALGVGGSTTTFDQTDYCAGKKVDPIPIEIQVPVEVPYEVTAPAPIAIYMLLDTSISMNDMSGGGTKWSTVVSSVDTFLHDDASKFLDVGLQYFPLATPACDGTVYDTPAVPVGRLPGNADAISNSLASTQLGNFTPIEPALKGMTSFCTQFQAQHPDEECVGVLISDGAPTQCALEQNVLISIAQNAYDTANVKTFTVGMAGADFNLLNQIAMWGGTDCTPSDPNDGYACDVSSGMTLIQAFEAIRKVITTLETRTETRTEIRNQIVECEWGLPDTPETVNGEGEEFNKDKVNVVFYEPTQAEKTISKIKPGTTCDGLSGGWYYDNENSPTKIVACPETCESITGVEGASIDIQLGCDTIILVK